MLYARRGWLEGVRELIRAGANVNLRNKWHETAYIISKKNEQPKTANLLRGLTTNKLRASILSRIFCMLK